MSVIGLDRLIQRMNRMASNETIAKGLEKTCLRIERDAKINCPVDMGLLRASINSDVDKTSLIGEVGTNVEYAAYVEFGTGIFSSEGTGRQDAWSYQDSAGNWHTTVGQRPQPYLNPALEANRRHATTDILNEVMRER